MTAAEVRPSGLTISGIVCTRGRSELLGECLASLARSLHDSDELIVVESGDGGALEAIDALGPGGTQIVHVKADKPGKCHQLNLGIRAARGDVLALTDDDVRVDVGWVDAMAACFTDTAVGIACGAVDGLSRAPGLEEPPRAPAGEAPFETWMFAHGAAMAVRTTAAWEAGGFDERLGPGARAVGEDHDFVLRVRERGWRVVVAAAPVADHVAWRRPEQDLLNALAYERGGGAVVGAALRRSRRNGWKVLKSRLGYQRGLLGSTPRFGMRALVSFAGGFFYGVRLPEREWL